MNYVLLISDKTSDDTVVRGPYPNVEAAQAAAASRAEAMLQEWRQCDSRWSINADPGGNFVEICIEEECDNGDVHFEEGCEFQVFPILEG